MRTEIIFNRDGDQNIPLTEYQQSRLKEVIKLYQLSDEYERKGELARSHDLFTKALSLQVFLRTRNELL